MNMLAMTNGTRNQRNKATTAFATCKCHLPGLNYATAVSRAAEVSANTASTWATAFSAVSPCF